MAIAVVASWEGAAGSTGSTFPIAVSGISAGDLLVVITANYSVVSTIDAIAPTDDGGNTYSSRVTVTADAGGTYRNGIGLSDCIVGTPPTTVTLRGSANDSWLCGVVLRITGHDPSSYAHAFATGKQQTADDPLSNALTTTAAEVLLVAGLTHDSNGNPTLDPPAGWTMQQEEENWGAVNAYAAATLVDTSPGSKSAQWITGASADYAMVLGAYSAVAADPVFIPQMMIVR